MDIIEKQIYQTVIDTIPNPIIITDGRSIIRCNQHFLQFFAYKTLKDFKKVHDCVCALFIKGENYFSLDDINKDTFWINHFIQNKNIDKVILLDQQKQKHIFKININTLEEDANKHVVVFTDITATEKEKVHLKELAFHDQLTGIYNRQFFHKLLKKEHENMRRFKDTLSIMMFDIDHFKRVNDTYGHDIGDAVLVTLSTLVTKYLRENDIFVRWGGEEFIILLPRTNVSMAYEKAHTLRKIIENYSDTILPKFTVSFGVTQILTEDKDQSCFIRVDKALYQAKIKRNDVVLL